MSLLLSCVHPVEHVPGRVAQELAHLAEKCVRCSRVEAVCQLSVPCISATFVSNEPEGLSV